MVAVVQWAAFNPALASPSDGASGRGNEARQTDQGEQFASAVFAGGCFWCVETDFENVPGVANVISGYSGGRTRNPTYETYATGGHREVVLVLYDPEKITYSGLVEYHLKHIDPTNSTGQFADTGKQYSPALYFETDEEKEAATRVVKAIDDFKVFPGKKVNVAIEKREAFWPAEEYHQDYHTKNAVKYSFFRMTSGRDAFVARHWGSRAVTLELPGAYPEGKATEGKATGDKVTGEAGDASEEDAKPWLSFRKPNAVVLQRMLTPIQFNVTQHDGTEVAFRNEFWNNKAEGIYVDIVSGAPLFSSLDKYKSGTGWPSFVKPIEPDAVFYKVDRKMFSTRTEVRSKYGDSHLGHVFNDGPRNRGGKRYCMNSAAMRFIPTDQMEEAGYGEYLKLFGKGKAVEQ